MCWNYEDCLEKTGREFPMLPHLGPDSNATLSVSVNGSGAITIPAALLVQPNTALLSMMLTLFTFAMAYYFKGLRNEKILGRTVS